MSRTVAKSGRRFDWCDAFDADVAQSVERVLGKDEVTGSIPVIGSIRVRAVEALKGAPASARRLQGEGGRFAGSGPAGRGRGGCVIGTRERRGLDGAAPTR